MFYGCNFITENDRKANIELLEANKAANKEDVRKLREENKEFRQKVAQLQRVSFPLNFLRTIINIFLLN